MLKNHFILFISAIVLASMTCCAKKSKAPPDCYKLHAMMLGGELYWHTTMCMDVFDALKENTPEARESAMLMLNIMIESYQGKITLLKKPPYDLARLRGLEGSMGLEGLILRHQAQKVCTTR